MKTSRGIRGLILAAACVGLTAVPAQAAERQTPSQPGREEAVRAARLWLGELLAYFGGPAELKAAASEPAPPLPELKQHVDNPGQTPMKN
jgi:hypothetical protein